MVSIDTNQEKLVYQHSDMLKKAITMFEAYPDLRRNTSCQKESRKIELSISDSGFKAILDLISKMKNKSKPDS